MNGYIGPAPSPYKTIAKCHPSKRGSGSHTPESVRGAMSGLVLPEAYSADTGLDANIRRSLFMTGPSGNGKTTIATACHRSTWRDLVPYAIEVDGQVIKVFDCTTTAVPVKDIDRYDERWIRISGPWIVAAK